MPAGQPLRGLVGQRMAAKKTTSFFLSQNFPGNTTSTFVAPHSRKYMFVLWGGGSGFNSGGSGAPSGAYCEVTRRLEAGQSATVVVGTSGFGLSGTNSSVTFPDGSVVTAGGAIGPAVGVATGGDVNLNGSLAGAAGLGTGGGAVGAGSGAGAPANLPFRGGDGAAINGIGHTPGGGANGGGTNGCGGDGTVLVFCVSD